MLWSVSVIVLLALCLKATNGQAEDILIGTLPNFQHGVRGQLYLRDTNTLVIQNFFYDGLGPATFLYYFKPGQQRGRDKGIIIPVPDGDPPEGSFVRRRRYTGDQLVITLPQGTNACDIGELTIWCRPFNAYFTAITFNHGTLFEKAEPDECVIKGRGGVSSTEPPSVEITTQAPTTETVTTEAPPRGVEIGPFPGNTFHGISGTLFVLDSETLLIKNFNYDGNAPGALLYYYSPGQVPDRNGGGFTIPVPRGDENGGFVNGRSYTNVDLLVPLPEGVDACDIGTLTIWCEPFTVFFAVFPIPRENIFVQGIDECQLKPKLGTLIPFKCPDGKSVGSAGDCQFDNCVALDDQLQLSWTVRDDQKMIDFRLCGCLSTDPNLNQYMGFGLSGSTSRTFMLGADPVITWVDETTGPHAVDYFLTGYFQCRGGRGACPDEDHFSDSCSNDIVSVSGSRQGGQQCVIYTRNFSTNDTCDLPVDPGNQNQYIVWGVGGLGETAFQHFKRASATDPPIHFGRTPQNQCRREVQCQQCSESFEAAVFEALENTTFSVTIGPSGADRGYEAIAGQVGWGIAYYINDTLVPELVVQRGQTYTFMVEAGNTPANPANYHPLYITDDIHGSRVFKTPEEKKAETVFAGFDENDNVTAAGRLCACTEGAEAARVRESCGSRQDYEESLECSCRDGEPAILIWTPDADTPDIVYYQCAIHLNLGWRIRVQNPIDPCGSINCPSNAQCKVFTPPFIGDIIRGTEEGFCDPSCELDNGGCSEEEECRLVAPACIPDRPCPFFVNCLLKDPCRNSECPSHAKCEVFDNIFTREAFCAPSCEVDNGGCEEEEVCSLNQVQCVRAPCPPVVECLAPTTPTEAMTTQTPDPCSSFECSSHAQCRVFQTGQAYCDPSCSVDNGGCEEDETCQLLATPCAAPPLNRPPSPCPLVVVCTPVTTPSPEVTLPTEAVTTIPALDPCDQLSCPSHATCEKFIVPFSGSYTAFCLPSCDMENGGCAEEEICSLVEQILCPADAPCPPTVRCSPKDPCSSFECPSHAQCRVFQTGQAYCDPSCSVDNGGCEEDETCQLLATPCAAPPLDRPPSPCPLVVVCTPVTTPTPEVTLPTEAVTTPEPDPCDQLSCPSHATCEKFIVPFSGSYTAFCLPSCDMENGGCAEEEICSLVEQILCPADAPCPPTVRCSPKDPCSSFECPSHTQCRVFQTGQAYCDPSCSVDNGGCEEDETCQLLATPCAAPPLDRPPSPCPPVVVCTPVTTPTPGATLPTEAVTTPEPDPCDQLSCPSHATCEKVLIQFISPSGFYAAFCLPSCDMENGGCAEEEICSLVEQICPADAPCPPTVRCSPKDPCGSIECSANAQCKVFTPPFGEKFGGIEEGFCDPSCELDNGGCSEEEECRLVAPACIPDRPCPFFVNCLPKDPCRNSECPSHAKCEVFDSIFSREAFCAPSCEVDNGGCEEEEVCSLNQVQCVRAPCPPIVECLAPTTPTEAMTTQPPDPCSSFECSSHAQCRVFQTGQAYCDPSCSVDNGGCEEDETCQLLATPCAAPPLDQPPSPCPLVVVCTPVTTPTPEVTVPTEAVTTPKPNPCLSFECSSHAQCRVFQTGQAYCDPSCSVDNGGCEEDETCQLLATPCAAPPLDRPPSPCPLVVVCTPVTTPTPEVTVPTDEAVTTPKPNPCSTVRCEAGYSCEVYEPTNEAYCEPSCGLSNGGCSLGTHCILRLDPECKDGPCPSLRSCCLYPRCDMDYCSNKATRRSLCTNVYGSRCGDEECPVTFCHACYFSPVDQPFPGNCETCGDYTVINRCTKKWAICTRRAHFKAYGEVILIGH
ncbi:mucin-2-like isoform X2 [Halichondria panicea]|uniref:mucin-2-like isoform X2 n=1 Tax=Halichondria panicea TaxID=6063 RepID=UPI00312B6CE5